MGQSTNAILFYGYVWDEETSCPWNINQEWADDDEEDDWEDRYAKKLGIEGEPEESYCDENAEEWRAYWQKKREAAGQEPCEVGTHCSCNYPMPYVAIKATKKVAHRGYPEEVTSLQALPQWDQQLKEFCRVMEIPVPEEGARWWLVSDWC